MEWIEDKKYSWSIHTAAQPSGTYSTRIFAGDNEDYYIAYKRKDAAGIRKDKGLVSELYFNRPRMRRFTSRDEAKEFVEQVIPTYEKLIEYRNSKFQAEDAGQ